MPAYIVSRPSQSEACVQRLPVGIYYLYNTLLKRYVYIEHIVVIKLD